MCTQAKASRDGETQWGTVQHLHIRRDSWAKSAGKWVGPTWLHKLHNIYSKSIQRREPRVCPLPWQGGRSMNNSIARKTHTVLMPCLKLLVDYSLSSHTWMLISAPGPRPRGRRSYSRGGPGPAVASYCLTISFSLCYGSN